MTRMHLAAGLLALAAVSSARAGDDDLRLRLPDRDDQAESRTLALRSDDDTDTLAAHWRGGFYGYRGGFYGGYRGWGVSGYRGWGVSAYRGWGHAGWGYRPWGGYAGWHRPVYGWGGYRGVYVGGYRPWGWAHSGYTASFYAPPIVSSVYYSPCAVVSEAPTTTLEYRILPATPQLSTTPELPAPTPAPGIAPPAMPKADGTYPYNGGPAAPVPMPSGGEDVMSLPRVPTPILDRVVSLKDEPTTGKFVYPAYGEQPRRTGK